MKTRILWVFRGPCGVGKSWLINKVTANENIKSIDMADAPRDVSWVERKQWLERKLDSMLSNWPDAVTLEGIFAPGTPSWEHVNNWCKHNNVEVWHTTMMAPLHRRLSRIGDEPTRKQFAKDYYERFE